ncbi:MAG TPA: DUF883 domain-containing protein [Burkholderiaceae bacterium]|jgi:ElaB/YqjD/DUF883 family membrane-anchored ribosome-binding protein
MLEENIQTINKDVDVLVKDAQALFQAATALTGEKADEMRNRGMVLLDTAMQRARAMQTRAVAAGKDAALTANDYVKENPWRAVAVAGGFGLLLGIALGNK